MNLQDQEISAEEWLNSTSKFFIVDGEKLATRFSKGSDTLIMIHKKDRLDAQELEEICQERYINYTIGNTPSVSLALTKNTLQTEYQRLLKLNYLFHALIKEDMNSFEYMQRQKKKEELLASILDLGAASIIEDMRLFLVKNNLYKDKLELYLQRDKVVLTEEEKHIVRIAENPMTSMTLLEELSKGDNIVQEAIASNPNTPPRLLLTFARKFPYHVGNNPSLYLLLIESNNPFIEIFIQTFKVF